MVNWPLSPIATLALCRGERRYANGQRPVTPDFNNTIFWGQICVLRDREFVDKKKISNGSSVVIPVSRRVYYHVVRTNDVSSRNDEIFWGNHSRRNRNVLGDLC